MLSENNSRAETTGTANKLFCKDYGNWYALQTVAGYEQKLVSYINTLCGNMIKLYFPVREVLHKIKGEVYTVHLPLFQGYVFVYKKIRELTEILDRSKSSLMAKPVTANGEFIEVNKEEMKFLFDITGEDGVIKLSKGITAEGDGIRIVNGPLKDLKGQILFINKRKNKAKARIEIMNRTFDVSLGLEIISPGPRLF
ncbi:MAG: transcription termination/antitermination NusG family protein [Desulfobacter sp.]